jgi:hypothetical protein
MRQRYPRRQRAGGGGKGGAVRMASRSSAWAVREGFGKRALKSRRRRATFVNWELVMVESTVSVTVRKRPGC